ncbi:MULTISPECIES: membrane protein [Prochlorococcus]|uniref:Predicted membrane protein n=1 Tax=Prochlorococcus marinus (strain SARG / CCMP1375 / SS120) TaxID=167539 RepID=Q7VBG3_PROMA|nr:MULTISPECIES: membrane protein [Prochlorococcus]AAQ00177.1 Predicted membrane protein [Prochlorococcus marinus subsp. marinus str. CCMP1375]KGG13975.1 putative Adenoviral fiber protein [Prochlorococcus marinus str. LG]KGG19108.1 putative Adenoviral fiber protein [Prochlorococcus marinus str. SS2]KGG23352.1 putative Adenoviral fiber protein [Prochlorococcus marinus str. SS35]KGG32412.1 putative Adenoviral fiber protein [Prochlorococcus marinus str. SS51]
MRKGLSGYWILSWTGLLANVMALPFIAYVVSSGPPLHIANLTIAISLAWPSAIVGIVASAGLLAERKWGVIMSIISISMVISASLPYGIVRLLLEDDLRGLSGISLLIALLNLFALIYWCMPIHRKNRRL